MMDIFFPYIHVNYMGSYENTSSMVGCRHPELLLIRSDYVDNNRSLTVAKMATDSTVLCSS